MGQVLDIEIPEEENDVADNNGDADVFSTSCPKSSCGSLSFIEQWSIIYTPSLVLTSSFGPLIQRKKN